LKPFVPFLYCLTAAQKVVNTSAKICRQLIQIGLRDYSIEKDFLSAAAGLFCTGKGLMAVNLPVEKLSKDQLKEWQLAVVDCSSRDVLTMLLEEGSKKTSGL
jgi:hypothetical protein